MKIYLVGGAIRDALLGRPVKERDWVVVGAIPDELLQLGFKPVGKDFPVFLHPKTHEEYALARTERKVSKGYSGFTFHAAPDVSLEEDLLRRDLTINAMAQDENGHIIDPYDGQKDLKAKSLHHVSDAFAEDPVRILRLARFSAKLPDFNTHPNTLKLMKKMVSIGEVDALVPERVWQELVRALGEVASWRFFEILEDANALSILFPEIKSSPQSLKRLMKISSKTKSPLLRFAALTSPLKIEQIAALCQRYRVPQSYKDLSLLVAREYPHYMKLDIQSASAILKYLNALDAIRRPSRFKLCLELYDMLDHGGKTQEINRVLFKSLDLIKRVSTEPFVAEKLKGLAFAKALENARIDVIEESLNLK
jgi:tRNA nucleotidyltransferase (CCA-adding enzyme)